MELTRLAANAASFLLDVSLRSLLVFLAAGMACLAMRHASAAARHLLSAVTLGGLLILPALCAWLPRWNAPVLASVVRPPLALGPSGERNGNRSGQTVTQRPRAMGEYATPKPPSATPATGDSQITPDSTMSDTVAPPPTTGIDASTSEMPVPAVPPFTRAQTAHSAAAPRPTVAEWLCVVWLIGFLAMLSRTLLGLLGAVRLIRRASRIATGTVAEATEMARHSMGLMTPLSVREGGPAAPVAVPMTFGFLRPIVLLPEGADEWPVERLRVVMMHEAAHIKRRDWSMRMLAQVAVALYWFHPLVWVAARCLRSEGEQACDDLVLSSGVKAVAYADHLVEVVRGLQGRYVTHAVVTMSYSHEVAARLRAILEERRNRAAVGKHGLSFALVTTVLLLIPLAAVRPVSSDPSQAPGFGVGQKAVPPKHWAVVADHGLRPMMTGRSKWDVTLPNDIRVRLLTAVVSSPGGQPECSWTPDGAPIVPLNTQLVRTYGPGPCQFLCGVVFPSARLQNGATVSGGEAGGTPGWTEGVPLWHNGQAVSINIWPNSPNAWAGNWAGQARGALQLTIASGPKATLIAAPPTQKATRRLPTGELLTLSRPVMHEWPALHRQVATTEVTATVPSRFVRHLTDYDFEVVGRDGRPLRVQYTGISEPDTSKEMTHISFDFRTSEAPIDRIKEFCLMYRPSQTAVFHDVALRPTPRAVTEGGGSFGAITAGADGSASSERSRYAAVLPDGTVMRLVRVSTFGPQDRQKPYGNVWGPPGSFWSPDGSPGRAISPTAGEGLLNTIILVPHSGRSVPYAGLVILTRPRRLYSTGEERVVLRPDGRADIVLPVSSGPYQTLVEGSAARGEQRRLPAGEVVTLSKATPDAHDTVHEGGRLLDVTSVSLTAPPRYLKDYYGYELMALGPDGRPVSVRHASSSIPMRQGQGLSLVRFTFRTTELAQRKVTGFRFVCRPVYEAAFRAVALRPNASAIAPPKTAPPSVSPADVESLSMSVSAAAVNPRRRRDSRTRHTSASSSPS